MVGGRGHLMGDGGSHHALNCFGKELHTQERHFLTFR